MVGSLAAGWVHDRFGRRWSLALGSFIAVVGVAICFTSSFPESITARRYVFLLGKFFEGKSSGMVICTAQTYISEISPHSLRAPSFALFPVFILTGQLLGAIVLFSQIHISTPRGYLSCIASQWAFSIALFIAAAIIPESPTWLLRKSRTELAVKSQRRLQNNKADPDAVVEELVAVLEKEKLESLNAGSVTFAQCFAGTNRRRVLIIIFANLLPQVFGTTFLANASYFFQTIGMDPTLAVKLLQVGLAIGLVANFISIWTLSAFGRRPLMTITLVICGLLYLGMGIAGIWEGEITLWYALCSTIRYIYSSNNTQVDTRLVHNNHLRRRARSLAGVRPRRLRNILFTTARKIPSDRMARTRSRQRLILNPPSVRLQPRRRERGVQNRVSILWAVCDLCRCRLGIYPGDEGSLAG